MFVNKVSGDKVTVMIKTSILFRKINYLHEN